MKFTFPALAALTTVAVAACAPASVLPTARPTTPSQTLSPTPTVTLSPTSRPTPNNLPASAAPLAFFVNSGAAPNAQQWKVVNAQGVQQWGLTPIQEGKLFGLTAKQIGNANLTPVAGATDLFLIYQASPTSAYQIAVFSRTGKLLGIGKAPAAGLVPNSSQSGNPFEVSPSGPEWAWTVDQTPHATAQHHGYIEVGGLGKTNRILYHWVAPLGFTEQLDDWTNTGIILQRLALGGPFPCSDGSNPAWFAVNPSTSLLKELATSTTPYMDARSGVLVTGSNDAHNILINGIQYSESSSIVGGVTISPDGSEVAVFRETFNPCGGGNIPRNSIELINVANHSHIDLPDLGFPTWWDNQQILAVPTAGSLWFYTLQGKTASQLSPPTSTWSLIGVLQ